MRKYQVFGIEMPRINRFTTVILLGAWATLAQVIVIREFLVVFYGNELILGVVMASWLIGAGLGAINAVLVSRKFQNDLPLFGYLQIAALMSLSITMYLIQNLRNIIGVPTGLMIPFIPAALSSFLLIAPISYIAGFCFPIAARITKNIGTAYILEGIGAFLGGVVFSFILAGRVDHFTILLAVFSLVTLNLALSSGWSNKSLYSITLCLFALLFFGAGRRIDAVTSVVRLKSINPKMEMLRSQNTKYQNIAIAKLEDQINLLSDGRFTFSFPDDYNKEFFANLIMNQHPHPRRVLLVGSGIAGEIYQILKYPIEKLDYAELDPQLIRLITPYILKKDKDALSDKRLSLFFSDGRLFVNRAQLKYDLIIVNSADASTAALNRFYTKEFFEQIKRILHKDGVFTIGITSALNYLGPDIERYAGSIYNTLLTVFPYVIVMPGDRNQFFCSFSKETVTTDTAVLVKRFLENKIKNLYFRPEVFKDTFAPEKVKSLLESLKKSQTLINTDLHPVSYYYNLILWNLFSGSNQTNIFRELAKVDLFKIIILIFASFLTIRLGWIVTCTALRKRLTEKYNNSIRKFNSYWAMFTVGFTAMAFEIILIFTFQNVHGYVYEMIGLIIGMFMLGMILAAAFSNNVLLRLQKNTNFILLANEALIVTYALILPWGRFFYIPFILLAGFLTGATFPLACAIYADRKEAIGVTAGLIDSADMLGASLGVLLTGTLFVPLLGITKTCFVIATLNLTSMVLVSLAYPGRKIYYAGLL